MLYVTKNVTNNGYATKNVTVLYVTKNVTNKGVYK